MGSDDSHQITGLLRQARDGDEAARSRLISVAYPELRRMAAAYLARERKGHTLQPTALVNEIFLRLAGSTDGGWQNRAHFFAICANLMRQVLVDHARRWRSTKRGGDVQRTELQDWFVVSEENTETILLVNEVIDELERIDPRQARVVELRYFVGLSEKEIAEVTGMTTRTVRRDWTSAKVWLHKAMSSRSVENDG